MSAIKCYKCDLRGHFARDCKTPTNGKKVGFSKGNGKFQGKGKGKGTLHHMVEDDSDRDSYQSNYSYQSDYGILNPSESDDDEEILDIFNYMTASDDSKIGSDQPGTDSDYISDYDPPEEFYSSDSKPLDECNSPGNDGDDDLNAPRPVHPFFEPTGYLQVPILADFDADNPLSPTQTYATDVKRL
jgi:Zinc knuckle